MFSEAQQRALVAIARAAVLSAVTGRELLADPPPGELPPATGAFVTLTRGGALRGCIGTLECRAPLADEIAHVAICAAREDPRFEPVSASELDGLLIELSILGPLERIDPHDAEAIVIGCHGLVVEQGRRRGLLLPQVAEQRGWDRDVFLAQTCHKAGLALDAWRRGAVVYRFSAEVFGD
ncbi:MAG: AmmeMemoRadiSam system protein A [Vicinamibacterales bacterium]